jgi:sigma-54 dependent transcriptional regulator, acetoin dehydrogenase operon transcriptional activator AcoR
MLSPFFVTRADNVSLAKKRYFEEGVLPTDVVGDAIFQSWSRCYRRQLQPQDKIEFQPVSTSRSQLALQKNRVLHEAWLRELPALGTALGTASCAAILTDATGVLIGASPSGQHAHRIIPVAHRLGVNLSEDHVGTTAPGIVARTGRQACVLGAEHFYESVNTMHCAAAPIRNIHGQLEGILDISSEGAPFHFDPSAVVCLYAASIENRLLIAQSREHLVISFQFIPAMLDTPMVGLLGFDMAGQLAWINSVASNLLGVHVARQERGACSVEDIFEIHFSQLASLAGRGLVSQRLRSGLHVFLTCEIRHKSPLRGGISASSQTYAPQLDKPEAPSSAPLPLDTMPALPFPVDSLKQADADLIQEYLMQYSGNISQVAKKLKVSRGLIYRRLKELAIDPTNFKNK